MDVSQLPTKDTLQLSYRPSHELDVCEKRVVPVPSFLNFHVFNMLLSPYRNVGFSFPARQDDAQPQPYSHFHANYKTLKYPINEYQ